MAPSLLQFENVFGTLDFEQKLELVRLLVREVRLPKIDPDKEPMPVDPSIFRTKIRTSWYHVSFQLYLNPWIYRADGGIIESSYLKGDGYPARTRTLND